MAKARITIGRVAGPGDISVEELVDKPIYAVAPVPVYRSISPKEGPIVFTVQPGQNVGTLYSWVKDPQGRGYWFQFYDANGRPYYTQIKPGLYDKQAALAWGARTVEQVEQDRQERERADSAGPLDDLFKISPSTQKALKWAALGVGGLLVFSIIRK